MEMVAQLLRGRIVSIQILSFSGASTHHHHQPSRWPCGINCEGVKGRAMFLEWDLEVCTAHMGHKRCRDRELSKCSPGRLVSQAL